MLIGEPYFSVEFLPYNGKFTVKHCVWSGGYNDIATEKQGLVFKQYDKVTKLCEDLNKAIEFTVLTK